MNISQLVALHDQQQRIEVEYRTMRREVTPDVIRHVALKHGEGMVLYSHLTAENADRVIAEQIAYFQQLGQDFEWKTYDYDTPGDLKDRLSVHGFEAEVPRSRSVLVEALDHRGEPLKIEATGWYARILQHEIDHINGVLFIDHISKLKRDMVMKKFKKAAKKTEGAKPLSEDQEPSHHIG